MYQKLLFPLLQKIDPETSHRLTTRLLALAISSPKARESLRKRLTVHDQRLETKVFNLTFQNPIGLAAGFDKTAQLMNAVYALGFGFTEVGTVTPLPQEGKERPRIFRLTEDRALINSMGFPGPGKEVFRDNFDFNLAPKDFPTGINIGPNQTSVALGKANDDYFELYRFFVFEASYITVNISSPNTENLRDLQRRNTLELLLDTLNMAGENFFPRPPILVKISPDLSLREVDEILDVVLAKNIAGIIATNTTKARPASLKSENRFRDGGLSGRPLKKKALEILRYCYQHSKGKGLVFILSGGVEDGEDAVRGFEAGADLIQIYTSFVYGGPTTVKRINSEIVKIFDDRGVKSISEIKGSVD